MSLPTARAHPPSRQCRFGEASPTHLTHPFAPPTAPTAPTAPIAPIAPIAPSSPRQPDRAVERVYFSGAVLERIEPHADGVEQREVQVRERSRLVVLDVPSSAHFARRAARD